MKEKTLSIRIPADRHEELKELAKKEDCSIKDFILSKVFNLPLIKPEKSNYGYSVEYQPKRRIKL